MKPRTPALLAALVAQVLLGGEVGGGPLRGEAFAQSATYADQPAVAPPYYRVRYEASAEPGEFVFPASYTLWTPPGVETLRSVVVHQHGCGVGSCRSGMTAAFDLHWQALARQHDCALLAPVYEQPEGASCNLWCDPRNGSAERFQTALRDLGASSGHPELARVPWALWGHSGGGAWAGGMTLLFPERVAAAWLRSGAPSVELESAPAPDPARGEPYAVKEDVRSVPLMLNCGTEEGATVKDGRFSHVWPRNLRFLDAVRDGGLAAVSVDPLTEHACGNQRYLAIPWFDACLSARLPASAGQPLRSVSRESGWLVPFRRNDGAPREAPFPPGLPMQSGPTPSGCRTNRSLAAGGST